ncbi:putative glyoxalase superfamily protein PhnB [Xanthomonas sp. F14]
MSEFSGLDAETARKFALTPAGNGEAALKYFEEVIGFAAKNQRKTEAKVSLPKDAFTPEGITYAVTQLSGRGFEISKIEGAQDPTYLVTFS